MKLHVLAVGKLRAAYARVGCDEYAGRLEHHFPIEVIEVRDADRRRGGRPADWRAKEADALLRAAPAGAALVALDEQGAQLDSRGLAKWLGDQRDAGTRALAFVIGGPDGLDARVREAAPTVWSLGRLTLPHELARLVLLEQLYRAATLLAGQPYHRD